MAPNRKLLFRYGAVAVLAGLSCCSPYVYKDGVTSFGAALTSVVSADTAGKAQLAADAQADQAFVFAQDRVPVTFSPPGCITGTGTTAPPCTIVAFDAQAAAAATKGVGMLPQTEQELRALQTQVAAADPIFRALQKYADGLVAVTNAGDQTAFNAAAASLASAVGGIAGAVDKSASSGASTAATVLGDIAGYYLESKRYSALKSAVTTADPLMAKLAQPIAAALSAIRTARIANFEAQIQLDTGALSPGKAGRLSVPQYTAAYDKFQTDLTALNQLVATDPKATVNGMVRAHNALAQALQSNQGQFAAFVTQVELFAADAQKLQQAFAVATPAAPAKPAAPPAKAKPAS